MPSKTMPLWRYMSTAFTLGFRHADIGLGYLGGLVARASSVGISLFVPLLVNAAFLSSGLCNEGGMDTPGGLPDIKRRCPRAYVLAAELTGVSQLVALLSAPAFGYMSAKFGTSIPLIIKQDTTRGYNMEYQRPLLLCQMARILPTNTRLWCPRGSLVKWTSQI